MSAQSNPVDIHVGARLRLRRVGLGMSQDALARALGVSFQQVQKYEHGANRLSASRLFLAARALNTRVAWFFEELDGAEAGPAGEAGAGEAAANDAVPMPPALAITAQGWELASLLSEIPETKVRRRLIQLARTLAEAARLARDRRRRGDSIRSSFKSSP